MRSVVQRVLSASVMVGGEEVAGIGRGLLVFLAVGRGDSRKDAEYMARKLNGLRVFPCENGTRESDRSLGQVEGELLVVPQFTLMGDLRKGNRPSFGVAEAPDGAVHLIDDVVGQLIEYGNRVRTGSFREHMIVTIVNDGPYTVLLDSKKVF